MFSSRQIASGLTGVSLLLSSTPALALGLGVGGSTAASSHISLPAGKGHANTKANVYLNGAVSSDSSVKSRANASAFTNAAMKADVKADAKVNSTALQMLRKNAEKALRRSIDRIAHVHKRICHNENSTDSAVVSCMNTAKVEFKAAINAMIDASFGV